MKKKLIKFAFLPILIINKILFCFFKLFPYKIRRAFIQDEETYKAELLKRTAKKYGYKTFVETGTYLGSTSKYLSNTFNKILTVELDKNLYLKSKKNLKNFNNVLCHNDDSKSFLEKIIPKIEEKTIFFLDAHYSGPGTSDLKGITPCVNELIEISKSKIKNHVIIIDDISDFSMSENKQKLSEIISIIESISSDYKFYFDYDMMFALPNEKIHREFFKEIIPHFVIR